jgi:hypothetical protein
MPAVPTVPTDPTVPTVPSMPAVPTVPTDPTVPTVPTVPSMPAVPTVPTDSTVPTVPSMPSMPAVPTVPTDPTVPTVPTVPSMPAVPTLPTDPTVPTVPTVPSMPAVPTVPTDPPVPTSPTVPSMPTVPTVPSMPAVPTFPTVPTLPPVPTIPTVPTVPTVPTPPSESPTEICSLDVTLTCEDPITGDSCDETAPLVDLKCGCEEGVGMDILFFVYSGPAGATLDCGVPFVFFNFSPGASAEFGPASTIPDSLSCQVLVSGSAVEEFSIDSSCDGDDGLVLQDEFGDLDGKPVLTFTGYACESDSDGDVEEHSCFLVVEYAITICNEGSGTEEIESVILNITFSDDGSILVLEDFGPPLVGTLLPGPENAPDNCVEVPYPSVIDVRTERE